MPLLFTYQCSEGCDFRIKGYGGPYMYLKIDDKEEILPHPLEDKYAKSLTGKSLDDLVKEGRVIFKHDRICLRCLQPEKDCKCEKAEFVEIPKLEGMTCPKCGKGKIIKGSAGIS